MDILVSLTPDELARTAGPRLLAKSHDLTRDTQQNPDVLVVTDLPEREDTLSRVLLGQLPAIAPRVYRRMISECGPGPWTIHTMVRLITEFGSAEAVLDHWSHITESYRTRRIMEARRAD